MRTRTSDSASDTTALSNRPLSGPSCHAVVCSPVSHPRQKMKRSVDAAGQATRANERAVIDKTAIADLANARAELTLKPIVGIVMGRNGEAIDQTRLRQNGGASAHRHDDIGGRCHAANPGDLCLKIGARLRSDKNM